MPQIDVTDVLLDPIIAGESFQVVRRLEDVNNFGERTEINRTYNVIGSVTPTGDNSLVREEGFQAQAKTIKVITKFMLRGPAESPPAGVALSTNKYDPDIVLWRGDSYVVRSVTDYSRYGAGLIEAECSSIDWEDQAPQNVLRITP